MNAKRKLHASQGMQLPVLLTLFVPNAQNRGVQTLEWVDLINGRELFH